MKLKVLPQEFSICRVEDIGDIDYNGRFIFINKTDKEISVVCESGKLPQAVVECKIGWKAIVTDEKHTNGTKMASAEISGILSGRDIGVFIVSPFLQWDTNLCDINGV